MPPDDNIEIDWKRVLGFVMMVVGAIGSAGALFYIWFIQLMLRFARHSLWDGFWIFAICAAVLLVSILATYIGVRMFRARNG
jgi:hypothetical protein